MPLLYPEARFAAMTDIEVIRQIWTKIGEIEDDRLSDELYRLTGELLERYVPELEVEATALDYAHDKHRASELESHDEALGRRARLREILRRFDEQEREGDS
jgi:hypothetical protein